MSAHESEIQQPVEHYVQIDGEDEWNMKRLVRVVRIWCIHKWGWGEQQHREEWLMISRAIVNNMNVPDSTRSTLLYILSKIKHARDVFPNLINQRGINVRGLPSFPTHHNSGRFSCGCGELCQTINLKHNSLRKRAVQFANILSDHADARNKASEDEDETDCDEQGTSVECGAL
jgi:hypothetical protein